MVCLGLMELDVKTTDWHRNLRVEFGGTIEPRLNATGVRSDKEWEGHDLLFLECQHHLDISLKEYSRPYGATGIC